MGITLRSAVFSVRQKLGEMRPWLWSDEEIIESLNEAARIMCSAAQSLTGFVTFNTAQAADGNWAQEYVLPLDVDQIVQAAYLSGTVFPLTPVPAESVQIGGVVGGIPFYIYIREFTKFLTPQVASTGGIQVTPIDPNQPDARTVIGLYPIPNAVLPVYLWYQAWHPNLQFPMDMFQIPDAFKLGLVAYAVARGKEKESAFGEAQYWDGQHEKYKQAFIDWRITNGQEITPPVYSNSPIPPYFLRGASSVIVVAQNPSTFNM